MLDIAKRKGIYDNSYDHYKKAIMLKERIEKLLKTDLYQLFPEIPKNDLENINNNQEELIHLLKIKKRM